MNDGCGTRCVEFARWSDLSGCWLKTSQGYSQQVMFEEISSEVFCATWPRSGLTISSGVAFQRTSLPARLTSAIASGLWRTPSATEADHAGYPHLSSQAYHSVLPTPTVSSPGWKNIPIVDKDGNPPDHANQRFYDAETGRLVQKGLEQVIQMFPSPDTCAGGDGPSQLDRNTPRLQTFVQMFPTPNTRDHKDTGDPECLIRAAQKEGGQTNLPRAIAMLPTPEASDATRGADDRDRKGSGGPNLLSAIQMYPTPNARDHKDSTASPGVLSRPDKLSGAVYGTEELYPTPNAMPGHSVGSLQEWGGRGNRFRGTEEGRGQLSADWVSILMGYPLDWTVVEDGNAESPD